MEKEELYDLDRSKKLRKLGFIVIPLREREILDIEDVDINQTKEILYVKADKIEAIKEHQEYNIVEIKINGEWFKTALNLEQFMNNYISAM